MPSRSWGADWRLWQSGRDLVGGGSGTTGGCAGCWKGKARWGGGKAMRLVLFILDPAKPLLSCQESVCSVRYNPPFQVGRVYQALPSCCPPLPSEGCRSWPWARLTSATAARYHPLPCSGCLLICSQDYYLGPRFDGARQEAKLQMGTR